MTMFEGPEYASYIALISELRLEWKFKKGDWWATVHREPIAWKLPGHEPIYISDPHLCNDDGGNFPGYDDDDQSYFPLPRLDQWLAMLEEAGLPLIGLQVSEAGTPCAIFQIEVDSIGLRTWTTGLIGRGPTREEAAARLWMAVAGRKATT